MLVNIQIVEKNWAEARCARYLTTLVAKAFPLEAVNRSSRERSGTTSCSPVLPLYLFTALASLENDPKGDLKHNGVADLPNPGWLPQLYCSQKFWRAHREVIELLRCR